MDRRFLLRGLFHGTAISMALPLFDCFLDGNGKALAATGQRIPTRFGTYFWGCGLTKELYAGTTSLFFTVGNATKAVPWLLLVKPAGNMWTVMAVCLLAIPAGVWLGWRFHGKLDQRQLYRACYGLLVVTALKLLWDGVSGYLA